MFTSVKIEVSDKDLCQAFLNNPNINPKTGSELKYGSKSYINYINLCAEYGFIESVTTKINRSNEYPKSPRPNSNKLKK